MTAAFFFRSICRATCQGSLKTKRTTTLQLHVVGRCAECVFRGRLKKCVDRLDGHSALRSVCRYRRVRRRGERSSCAPGEGGRGRVTRIYISNAVNTASPSYKHPVDC